MELLSGSLPLFEFIIAFVFVLWYCDMANKLLSLSTSSTASLCSIKLSFAVY